MRNPYIVGRWLRGDEHYGRHKLLDHLLATKDQAIWLVGTRRMGKTSLLRQLEWLIDSDSTSVYVPLFWDMQACETANDLAYELFISIEDETERFARLGIDIPSLQTMDVSRILRYVQRSLNAQGKQLLLLIDEAEALINVAKNDNRELARLRRALQQGEQRTILTATKQLMQLNELMRDWLTSPFLFGFHLVNLWSLDVDAAQLLVCQGQSDDQVLVDSSVMEEVITYTHRHPYLTQYLCHRLFEADGDGIGHLRPVQAEDLHADHLLSGFLQIDYNHLSPTERQILLAIAGMGLWMKIRWGRSWISPRQPSWSALSTVCTNWATCARLSGGGRSATSFCVAGYWKTRTIWPDNATRKSAMRMWMPCFWRGGALNWIICRKRSASFNSGWKIWWRAAMPMAMTCPPNSPTPCSKPAGRLKRPGFRYNNSVRIAPLPLCRNR